MLPGLARTMGAETMLWASDATWGAETMLWASDATWGAETIRCRTCIEVGVRTCIEVGERPALFVSLRDDGRGNDLHR